MTSIFTEYELPEPFKLTRDEIAFCIKDPDWQKVRRAMKGQTTEQKLEMLQDWYRYNGATRCTRVQIVNYLNALKRGGQINMNWEIAR